MIGSRKAESRPPQRNGYVNRLKAHLAEYKRNEAWGLKVSEDGSWRGTPYSHILPKNMRKLNVLESVRDEFWTYWEGLRNSKIGFAGRAVRESPTLHTYFHHLTSSQALAFNLFFPFRKNGFSAGTLLFQALGVPPEAISDIVFEDEPDSDEGSNFDVTVICKSGHQVIIEIKLTESEFGTCEDDDPHNLKLTGIYTPRLRGKVSKDCLEKSIFFKHYQLLRHFARLDEDRIDVVFLFPKENKSLRRFEAFINTSVLSPHSDHVHVVYLEDFVARVLAMSGGSPELQQHFRLLARKYSLDVK